LILLGRSQNNCSIDDRLDNIIINDGLNYLGLTVDDSTDIVNQINNCIHPISFDLTRINLELSSKDLQLLKDKPIDYFIHVAALTDFRSDAETSKKLNEVNYNGTKRILELIEALNVKEFIFIGSAYSCGDETGIIHADHINISEVFRNPYEKSKLKAEISVRNEAKKGRFKLKIYRPSTIGGRLIEKNIGSISKFDVFYSWAAFFLKHKIKYLRSYSNLYSEPVEMNIRIQANNQSGLNIVPVDFAAKSLYLSAINDPIYDSYHLANNAEVKHMDYIQWILDYLGIFNYEFCQEEPNNKNDLEKIYYRSVGRIFSPYIIGPSMIFNVKNLNLICDKYNVYCPIINKRNFIKLLDYAKGRNFGLKLHSRSAETIRAKKPKVLQKLAILTNYNSLPKSSISS